VSSSIPSTWSLLLLRGVAVGRAPTILSIDQLCTRFSSFFHFPFFSATRIDHQFWLVFLTTLQSPNIHHSSISTFDSRQRIVYIDSTNKIKMTIETSISSQVGTNNRPYFQCVHHRLVPGQRHQRHWHSSKSNSWYWQLVYTPGTGMISVFLNLFQSCTRDKLLQETDKYTTPAANPVRATLTQLNKSINNFR